MSAFCSGLCNEISRCCYDFYHAPFTKKNLLIGGGVIIGLVIIIVIIVVASTRGSSESPNGSAIIKQYPLIDGANSLSKNIKNILIDQLSKLPNNSGIDSNLTKYWSSHSCNSCQTDLNRLKLGHVATQIFSITTDCAAQGKDAVSQTLEQIDAMKRIIAEPKNNINLVKKSQDIHSFFEQKKTGALLNVWGGHNIDSRLAVLRMYYDLGVRIMAIVSADPETNTDCYPPWAFKNGSLSDFGKDVISEMNRVGMIIDLAGCSTELQTTIFNVTKSPAIFSRSASKTVCENVLNIDDQTLNHFKDSELLGIIMVPFTPQQLTCSKNSTINNIISHFQILSKYVKVEKLGIGSNFDNMTEVTSELEDVSKFNVLFDKLLNKTSSIWNENGIKDIASNNFINVFKTVEKISAEDSKSHPLDEIIPRNYVNTTCYSDTEIRYPNKTTIARPTKPPSTNSSSPNTNSTKHSN